MQYMNHLSGHTEIHIVSPAVGTSCFGDGVILSSKAIKGVAIGGGELAFSSPFWLKSRIWSNSGCWASSVVSSSGGGCFIGIMEPESRSKREAVSFFLKKESNQFGFRLCIHDGFQFRISSWSWYQSLFILVQKNAPYSSFLTLFYSIERK